LYTKTVPFHDYNGKARNLPVHFMLEAKDVFKLFVELNAVLNWREGLSEGDPRDLTNEEMVEFFNNFEVILLESWGVPSADGLEFDRTGKYSFEQSKLFAAFMELLLSDITEVNSLLEKIMPKGLEEIVKKQAASLEQLKATNAGDPAIQAEIARLTALQEAALKQQVVEGTVVPNAVTPPDAPQA